MSQFQIKSITVKNFLSVGEVTQSVNFEGKDLVLVLGENLDQGGDGSRNGVGKSLLVNALSYALFGQAMTNIKLTNLINKTNGKNMIVTLDFSVNGADYRIERGRSPNRFAFFLNGHNVEESHEADEAQGESRLTQQEVERVIGLSHVMFKNIVALNTFSEPFLAMRAGDQRDVIEQLLGITKLSEKAVVLKELTRDTRDAIKGEQLRITAVQEANRRIEENIRTLQARSAAWRRTHAQSLQDIQEAIGALESIDTDRELSAHAALAEWKSLDDQRQRLEREVAASTRQVASWERLLENLRRDQSANDAGVCHTCGHSLEDEKHQQLAQEINDEIARLEGEIETERRNLAEMSDELGSLPERDKPETFYDTVEEAYQHRSSVETLMRDLEREEGTENPHDQQIQDLRDNGLQEVNYDEINRLTELKDHQDFLLRLLTNKDSFIRKKIVDQNLSYLNQRLKHYLDQLGLPHNVVFQNDLSVLITEHGRDLDYGNLSRGEGTRLILSLSLAFRDVYESINHPISLLFIDELIDSGLDTAGVESALRVLKKISRDQHRNIFLISHRDELQGRVDNVLRVIKSNGFTSFDEETL